MKTLWSKLTTVQKILGTFVLILGSIVALWKYAYSGYDHFATKAYADTGDNQVRVEVTAAAQDAKSALHDHIEEQQNYQKQQVISNNRAEIWRAKREIKRLRYELEDPELPHAKKVRIETDIKEYEDLIECIRAEKELCY